MSKIYFLDIDGPVISEVSLRWNPNNRRAHPHISNENVTYWAMDDAFKHLWTHLTSLYKFQVVVSSTWRKIIKNKHDYIELFDANELSINLHDDWQTPIMSSAFGPTKYDCMRATEIHTWLQQHPEVDDFIIVDDPWSGASLDFTGCHAKESKKEHKYMQEKVVLVNPDTGLGSIDCNLINARMKSWM